MASSSSLSLSIPSSSLSRNCDYDVFLSFHGADVRRAFLSHILKEFRRKLINPFIDNEIKRGKFIPPELKKAIQGSRIAIVLLSKRYASSSWCLDELLEIMKCKKELGQTVITIFYEVDPTDVKKQTGDFGNVFRNTCAGKKVVVTRKWSQALAAVATIAGYHSRNWDDDAVMIENIADVILNMLFDSTPSRDFDDLIGMGAHMKRMEPLLRLDWEEVRMIGIWGPPGIGKTTIARFLFSQLSYRYQLSVFMESIKERYTIPACSDEHSATLHLQQLFLSQIITSQKDFKIPHLGIAQDRLKDKKVLIVLDDVNHSVQLNAMAGKKQWFGPESLIFITTQDRRLLRAHGIKHIYKVDYPTDEEAFQIFCMYAFQQKSPYDGYEELSREVTRMLGKLPLGLKVMGSYFRGMSKQEWTMELQGLRTQLDGNIESILKLSYDALFDEDKDLFLHIACFFNHQKMKKVEEHLAKSLKNVRQRLHVLADKSLISISDWGYIEMHDLLVQLGTEIVRKQSVRKPGKRQFLVDAKDICEVLTEDTKITRRVIGINYTHQSGDKELITISEGAIKGMSNLQFLRFRGETSCIMSMPECLNYISPKLRLLEWNSSPMTCLPFTVDLESLVELEMIGSKLEKLWEGNKSLRNLKWMDLSYSTNLMELPNLSTAINLQNLYLNNCSSLVELPSSIGNATNLQILDLDGCSSLVELPSSIGNATNLQQLYLYECSSLVELPSSIGNATNLQELYLSGCSSLVELPSLIGNATNLHELCLPRCSSMVELPSTIGNLHKLSKLDLKGCSKLEALPTNINMESLKLLDLTDCSLLKSLPEISTNIKYLDLKGTSIEEVPSSIRSSSNLEELRMSFSENLKKSPHALDSITMLELTDSEIKELGPWVKGCSRLRKLVLDGMQKLVSLSELPDSLLVLDAENCESLERLDCSFCNPDIRLNFRNCFKLNQEARDLIIKTSTCQVLVLPGVEVPDYFTIRAFRSSVTVKLNQKPLRTSTKFKACISVANKGVSDQRASVECKIMSKQNTCASSASFLGSILSDHLYIFELEATEVTSTELDFEFKLNDDYTKAITDTWEILECGIFQLLE